MSVRRATPLARLYFALALLGAVVTNLIFLPWLADHGVDAPLFVSSLFVNGPASIFSSDALLSSLIFLLFVATEGPRVGMRRLWIYPLVLVTIGLCCALPLFLGMRERNASRAPAAPLP